MTYRSPVVLRHRLSTAVRAGLAGCLIEAMRIAVVAPGGLGPQLPRHFQGLLHEYPAVLLEATLRLLLNRRVAPQGMPLTFQFYGQGLVGFEGGPVLPEDRPPALKVYYADAAERAVGDLLDQVLAKRLEMFLQITFLRHAAVPSRYVP